MDHSFISSQLDNSKCARCKYTEIDHTDRATCETCGNSGNCEIFAGMLMCSTCKENEIKALMEHQSPEKQAERARLHNQSLIEHSRTIDQSIKVKTDIFNAETVAITDLFKAIDENPEIQNKLYVKASELKNRIDHFQKVIFDSRSVLQDATERHQVIQTQLNELANKLRQDERERLKLNDINYQPGAIRTVKPKSVKVSTKKWNKADVREAAAKYKVPIDAVQMICVARNMDAESAAMMLAKQIHGE